MRIKLDHAYTSCEISEITQGRLSNNKLEASYLCTDSREVEPGDLFVALHGDKDDGHAYLESAAAAGAAILLCEEGHTVKGCCTVEVRSTERALASLAAAARTRIDPTVIAITGSVGKTTTKNTVAAILSTHFQTHKTYGNFNNLLGVCLTLLSMPQDTEILVCELGMNHSREISELSTLVAPDIAVITNVGTAHIGQLGSRAAIARAKLEILEGCRDGALYLFPGEEPLLSPPKERRLLTIPVGKSPACLCRYENAISRRGCVSADFICNTTYYPAVKIPGIGLHLASCAAFAIMIGQTLGLTPKEIRHGLASLPVEEMRQKVLKINGITVIEDCYNASPESVQAALTTLVSTAKETYGRALALLGDMLELGTETRILHEQVGWACADAGIDLLFTFGAAAENIAVGAAKKGMHEELIFHNPDPSAPDISAMQILTALQPRDVILIKASRALAAERIIDTLKKQRCNGKENKK
ncbi:MAG: UDP-N-acetylmuramoyl-tripeptide--D-alanyl-D-alanine ligase [Clostridia bacterium]|nr:UDP-N-acetylmuramoyl-tripeptide--D-alanyl-D-alanine ligase [Clostridia bacterium]